MIQIARANFCGSEPVSEPVSESVRLPDLELLLCEIESELKMKTTFIPS